MIEVIQKAIKQGIDNAGLVGVMEGEVVSAPPNLKVRLKNNSKLIISKELLVVPQKLTDYTMQCSIMTDTEEITSITLKNNLKIGDKIMLVSFEGGQRFYILDKI
jgi:hypothetical protein